MHFSQPAEMEAINSDGSSAGTTAMSGPQNVAEVLTLSGPSLETVVIRARADETLLLRFCFVPLG